MPSVPISELATVKVLNDSDAEIDYLYRRTGTPLMIATRQLIPTAFWIYQTPLPDLLIDFELPDTESKDNLDAEEKS